MKVAPEVPLDEKYIKHSAQLAHKQTRIFQKSSSSSSVPSKFYQVSETQPLYFREQEKRIELSDSGLGSNKAHSEMNDDNDSINLGYLNEFNYNPRAVNTNFQLVEEEKRSEYQSRHSFLESERDKQSVGTFQNNHRTFRGVEQSEICKLGPNDSENTSTIRCALHQVTKIVNAHEHLFYKSNNQESEMSRESKIDEDENDENFNHIYYRNNVKDKFKINDENKETKLFQIVKRQAEEFQPPKVVDFKAITNRNSKSNSNANHNRKSNEISNSVLMKYKENEIIENVE